MESSPVTERIPVELIEEFILHCSNSTRALCNISLVCHLWREISQRRLFKIVRFDPERDHTIYAMATSNHTPVKAYIKQLHLFGGRGNPADATAVLHPRFVEFLLHLSAVEVLVINHQTFCWRNLPEDAVNAFLHLLQSPSIRSLIVPVAKSFPSALFLRGPSIKHLTIKDVQTLDLGEAAGTTHAGSEGPQTCLRSLCLAKMDTIDAFWGLVSSNLAVQKSLERLGKLTIEYYEPSEQDRPWCSDTVSRLLRRVGKRLLGLEINLSRPKDMIGYHISLNSLQGLRYLWLRLIVQKSALDDLTCAALDYITSVVNALPNPESLRDFHFLYEVFPARSALFSDHTNNIDQFFTLLETAFDADRFGKLREVTLTLNLYEPGGPSVDSPCKRKPLPQALPGLRARGIRVNVVYSDPALRAVGEGR